MGKRSTAARDVDTDLDVAEVVGVTTLGLAAITAIEVFGVWGAVGRLVLFLVLSLLIKFVRLWREAR